VIKLYIRIALLVLIVVVLSSCKTTKDAASVEAPVNPLLVGVTPNYPPLIFKRGGAVVGKRGGEIVGIDADLARLLAGELGRSVKFVQLDWDAQIPALLSGKTDIIMSGMTVTRARKIRINFSDHYLKSGLVAMMRLEDARKYNSIESIKQGFIDIGVVRGTTSDVFVRQNFPDARRIVTLQKAGDAPPPLKNRTMDIFIHDAPSIMWHVSENEADLAGLWEPLHEESLAWGVRRDEEELLMQVNTILNKWRKDGTLNKVLLRWLPEKYLERFK
jgi:polar amino acid transport system substrate-binding protein